MVTLTFKGAAKATHYNTKKNETNIFMYFLAVCMKGR